MTSNIGSQAIADYNGNGEGYEHIRAAVSGELRNYFRPEFLNRVDEIVIFHALAREHIRSIAAIQLERFRERLAANGIGFEISDEALDYLAAKGFDPVYGARPLKRAIVKEMETPVSRLLIAGTTGQGDTLQVVMRDGAPDFGVVRKE